jgi:hypothetical protein
MQYPDVVSVSGFRQPASVVRVHGNKPLPVSACQFIGTALLELLSAATWTWVIPANFWQNRWLNGVKMLHFA